MGYAIGSLASRRGRSRCSRGTFWVLFSSLMLSCMKHRSRWDSERNEPALRRAWACVNSCRLCDVYSARPARVSAGSRLMSCVRIALFTGHFGQRTASQSAYALRVTYPQCPVLLLLLLLLLTSLSWVAGRSSHKIHLSVFRFNWITTFHLYLFVYSISLKRRCCYYVLLANICKWLIREFIFPTWSIIRA